MLCIKMNSGFSQKDYYQDYYQANKETLLKYGKNYREVNKDKLSTYKAEWYIANPDYNNDYYKNNKIYFKDYYQKNKEKLNTKITCECGGKHTYANKTRHEKTNKHQKWLLSQS